MDLSVSYIYGESFELAKKKGFKIVGLLLIIMFFSTMFAMFTMPHGYFDAIAAAMNGNAHALERVAEMQPNFVFTVLQYVAVFLLYAALYNYLISCVRGRQMSVFGSFKMPVARYLKFVAALLAVCVVLVVGFVCLIVPGVYLGARLIWVPYYVLEHEEAGIADAFKWSWRATDGRVLELVGLAFMAVVVMVVAMIACGILLGLFGLLGAAGMAVYALLAIVGSMWLSAFIELAQIQTYVELCGNATPMIVSVDEETLSTL